MPKKPDRCQFNCILKPQDMAILRSIARHNDWTMTKVITAMLRKTGKPRGRPRINFGSVK